MEDIPSYPEVVEKVVLEVDVRLTLLD